MNPEIAKSLEMLVILIAGVASGWILRIIYEENKKNKKRKLYKGVNM